MKTLHILMLLALITGCAGHSNRNTGYMPQPGYYPAAATNDALIFHGDGSPTDMFFGDGSGGGIMFHGDGSPADMIFGQ